MWTCIVTVKKKKGFQQLSVIKVIEMAKVASRLEDKDLCDYNVTRVTAISTIGKWMDLFFKLTLADNDK